MPAPKRNIKTHKVSVQKRNLISIPREIRERLKISEGDVLDVKIEGNKIVMEPYKLIPSSQAYFWTEATQKDMLEAKEDVKAGRVRKFENADEFVKGLDND
ncbi:AbrB/MazE/SpoVT family DNA-binding domain-containing protein [Phosphitispora fastidiosa]|uniref:AbrB/MazE/SpoVT family DNA-binding domain-containing protein n=1 Tax=Phosphitispora fastidiosa TaxID=2837202 RepID=UPI001E3BB5DF|nr:AbrB/MazE/SpoVT family DNA-binding domain-containing protein [Phosphitispora fastidiosa]MBU7007988.1 AbrB family looped-hinge helix DNA binding protein [Phosphitispora fastidiosa]